MDPQIRYVRSADGTRIATASLGSGTPLVMIPGTPGNIESYFSLPEVRAGIDFFEERFRFVTYDPRGRGLSDRNVTDWSLEARVSDVVAVIQGLSLPPSYLLARAYGSLVGIAFAAKHPDLVRRLGLYAAAAHGSDFLTRGRFGIVESLPSHNWPLFCKYMALAWFDWTDSGRTFADQMTRAFSPESFLDLVRAQIEDDAKPYLEQVACPTLIVQPQEGVLDLSTEGGREVAARMKDARFRTSKLTDWVSLILNEEDARAFAEFFEEDKNLDEPITGGTAGLSQEKIDSFIAHASKSTVDHSPHSGTALILFADIADSTALTERLGDSAFREKARDLDGALRKLIADNGGTCIDAKTLGDGVLAVFTSARQAIEAALACARSGDDAGLPLHLGLHAGDVIREEGNVYGGAVNIASRISGLSSPGEVLVSETVRSLARTSAGVRFEDRGEQSLKGVGEPVRVWAVVADAPSRSP